MSRAQVLTWQEQTGAHIAEAMQDVLDAMPSAHPYRNVIENCMLMLLGCIDDGDMCEVRREWAGILLAFGSDFAREMSVVTEALMSAPMMLVTVPPMKMICSWCLGVISEGVEPASHGICESCANRICRLN